MKGDRKAVLVKSTHQRYQESGRGWWWSSCCRVCWWECFICWWECFIRTTTGKCTVSGRYTKEGLKRDFPVDAIVVLEDTGRTVRKGGRASKVKIWKLVRS